MRIPELLLPAGDMESLTTALIYGADAVYLGADGPNLRARAAGFAGDVLAQAVAAAHAAGVKVYVCVNATPRQQDLPLVRQGLDQAVEAGADGLIISDPGVARLAVRHAPALPIHVSTQANTRNAEGLAFWRDFGARRANLARECAAREVAALCAARDAELAGFELEVFAHGAQCMAFSGRCQLSVHMTGRAVNEPGRTACMGACAHPCRYEYRLRSVVEERKREGADAWEVLEQWTGDRQAPGGEAWTQYFAPQDLCLIWQARWLAKLGVDCLKIEGRTRSSAYLAVVGDAWRFALDSLAAGSFQPRAALAELRHAATRPLTSGLFGADPRRTIPGLDLASQRSLPLLRVLEASDTTASGPAWDVELKGTFDPARPEGLTLLLPGLARPVLSPQEYRLERTDGLPLTAGHPGVRAVLVCAHPALRPGIFAR
ncbi:MAG: peptidase U32 [Deltaproteobacteria bacterium HGW-Deltaproteobacteria-8]|jgi:putative protease|nr:MAG: peptidase U32 [Deltaproteobacteria bacterium HGW-Deltaproteobacteria-8]